MGALFKQTAQGIVKARGGRSGVGISRVIQQTMVEMVRQMVRMVRWCNT
jgi:hypothetical protein